MQKYIQNKNTLSGKLEDERVMLDMDKGKYFALNPVATRIWELLDTPLSLEELCLRLQKEYEVAEEQCKADVSDHLAEMVKLGMIKEAV